MAAIKKAGGGTKITFSRNPSKRTSIGRSHNSRPKGKHARKDHKPYRGQGYP